MTGMTNQRQKPDNSYEPTSAIARWESEGGALRVAGPPIRLNLKKTASSDAPGQQGKQKISAMKRTYRGD